DFGGPAHGATGPTTCRARRTDERSGSAVAERGRHRAPTSVDSIPRIFGKRATPFATTSAFLGTGSLGDAGGSAGWIRALVCHRCAAPYPRRAGLPHTSAGRRLRFHG